MTLYGAHMIEAVPNAFIARQTNKHFIHISSAYILNMRELIHNLPVFIIPKCRKDIAQLQSLVRNLPTQSTSFNADDPTCLQNLYSVFNSFQPDSEGPKTPWDWDIKLDSALLQSVVNESAYTRQRGGK